MPTEELELALSLQEFGESYASVVYKASLDELRNRKKNYPLKRLGWRSEKKMVVWLRHFGGAPEDTDVPLAISQSAPIRITGFEQLKENEQLQQQVAALTSRVAQEQKVAAREMQRRDELQETLARLENELIARTQANDALQQALSGKNEGRLKMYETHTGVVMHVDESSVEVTYEISDGEYVDQTYSIEQFIDGKLPEVGTDVAIFVHVAERPPSADRVNPETRQYDGPLRRRREIVPPPREI